MVLTCRGGYSSEYLLGEVQRGLSAAGDGPKSASAYYTGDTTTGEPPGLWWGEGARSLGLTGVVEPERMQAVFDHRLDPRDPASGSMATWGDARTLVAARRSRHARVAQAYRELLAAHPGAGPERRASLRVEADRQVAPSTAALFDDVHFAPPKSVTVVWAAARAAAAEHRAAAAMATRAGDHTRAAGETAQERVWATRAGAIEAAVLAGHAAALGYLEEHHCYVRTGHHGQDKRTGQSTGKWLKGHGLTAAQFLQHDSRDRDPQLHVHGPVLNAVQGPDGKWRGLDRKSFRAGLHAASAIAHRTMEARISTGLGLRFETRPDGKAREVVGVDDASREVFSSRRRALAPEAARLIAEFTEREGREPTGPEQSELRQIATLATRSAKSKSTESHAQTTARWAAKHRAEVGATLREAGDAAFAAAKNQAATWSEQDVIDAALWAVSEDNGSWTRPQLMDAVNAALPGNLGIRPEQVRPLLEQLTDTALTKAVRLTPEPDSTDLPAHLRREDGTSIYSSPAPPRYATPTQLLGQVALRERAIERGAATVDTERVEQLLTRYAAAGTPLSADQETALRGICSSGAMLEVLAAPAGTGKSFLDGVLVQAWEGIGPVRGIAFGQLQADVLKEEGVEARNMAAWLAGQQRLAAGRPVGDDEAFRLVPGGLLIVDEAQLAGTTNLVRVAELTKAAGTKLLLTGDPAQGGLGQAGTLADLAGRAPTRELHEVRRFSAEWEREASLRLRDGDTTALSDYDRHGRLLDAGAREQAEHAAGRAWLADSLAGRESLVVVPSNEAAARIGAALRAELVRLGRVEEVGVPLGMQGTTAGVGDLIQARFPDRNLGLVNRSVWRVREVRPDGSLLAAPVRHDRDAGEQLGEPRVIPADYVAEHVSLAYASTQTAAIGRTVDTCHALVSGSMARSSVYVALTRGRDGNWGYVFTQDTGEDAASGDTAQATRRDPVGVLADVLTRAPDAADLTALAQLEQGEQAARELPAVLHPLITTLGDLAQARTSQLLDRLVAREVITEANRAAFATDPATGSLTQLLRRAELAGHDPDQLLTAALGARDLTQARSVAQVTHARIATAIGDQTSAPTIASFHDLISASTPASHRPVLERWAEQADERRAELGADAAGLPEVDRPAWLASLGPVPTDPLGRVEWETRAGWAASWRELEAAIEPLAETDPVGAAPGAGLVERRAVWQTAHEALDLGSDGTGEGRMSDGQLRARVRAYERERVWAPRYVADELAATHEALRRAEQDATIWRARAGAETDPDERARLLQAAQEADGTAFQARERLPSLEAIDTVRGDWYAHTAGTRENAQRAETELGIRGIDRAAEPHVTAQEWLVAHLAAQAADEATREVGEDDVDDRPEDFDQSRTAVGAAGTTEAVHTGSVGDIRMTAQPDLTEWTAGPEPRRMPPADETAAALTRAQDAAREIAARTGWDTEQEQSDDSEGPAPARGRREADDRRAEQLNSWAVDDRRDDRQSMKSVDCATAHSRSDGDVDD